ncbi:divalent-cation tolerance protein CutA [Hyphomonas sp.]|uniref:divalent-cation tolerance protein CutA n=1 Tax=Hyphomonas sp. TaxID=87 RepID=UPI003F72347E
MTDLLLVRITCPSRRVAEEIADAAVEQRLAACANLEGPVTSTYRWKGVVEHAFEFVLWMKAPESRWSQIEALVNELHPYEVPAIVALPCAQASAPYAAWVNANTDS